MPVSPADFEFYSRMTGQPIPNTPAGRMAIAPQVYNMRRGGGGFGRFVRGAAQGALAAGALAGAGALALATQEEMAKEGPKVKVTENLTDTGMTTETTPGGQKVTVSATDSAVPTEPTSAMAAPIRDRVNRFIAGPDEELIGTAATPEQIRQFRNRYSGQTVVPQADPSIANESRGAQLASTSEPTQPRVEVRQQPSSGSQVTELSNVAATEPAPLTVREKTSDLIGRVFGTAAQAPGQLAPYASLNPQEQEIRDLMTAYEAVEGQALAGQDQSISPFQVGGAMLSLR